MKTIATESEKTKKARKKLEEQWAEQAAYFTLEAKARACDEIRKRIADHVQDRLPVKGKIELFNHNRDPAALSKKVQMLAERLKEGSVEVHGLEKKVASV